MKHTMMLLKESMLIVCVLIICNTSSSKAAEHSLFSAVKHYETLHKINDIHSRVVRDTVFHPSSSDNFKLIQFTTLGREFKLLLKPHTEPFHPHSHVHYDSDAKVPIDVHKFHKGHVIGAESSDVIAHITDDGLLTAIIETDDDEYYIEPSFRHFRGSHDFHMITYRGSDLKLNMTGTPFGRFCGVTGPHDHYDDGIHGYDSTGHTTFSKSDSSKRPTATSQAARRLKRQMEQDVVTKSVCPVHLVATTSFYQQFGASNVDHTVNFLLVVLLRINNIFLSTDWDFPGVTGTVSAGKRGLQIANVTVHSTTGDTAYNRDRDWSSSDLLRSFALTDWDDYCIAHLFTARSFTDSSRLGVAYTAFANSIRAGGVCSERTTYEGDPFSGNVALSSFRASDRFLVLAEAIVVSGHEFGHSWGSGHDPDSAECSPPFDINGGKYLMYAFAQDGQSTNNKVFSDCSRRAISLVLNTHESVCFETPSTGECGNFQIDAGEECDPGPSRMLQDGDDCCHANCTFKTNATSGNKFVCSDANHDCCFECSPSPVGEICVREEPGNINCFGNRTCNGIDRACPETPVYMPEGEPCGIMGQCMVINDDASETICTNFCELQNLTTCFCSGGDECSLCCKDSSKNQTCAPFGNSNTPLPSGRFCEGGTCDGQGVCIPSDPELSTFLFDLLTDFNTAAIVQFTRENIVGVVIVLSLIVWIPCSVGVHLFDISRERKREKLRREEKEKKERKRRKKKEVTEKIPLIDDVDSPVASTSKILIQPGHSLEHAPITKHVSQV